MFPGVKPKKKKGLDYERTIGSPYPKGSAEDRKLSADKAAYSAKNRANFAQGFKDVASGRALVEGVKVVLKAPFKNALKVDDRHNRIIRKKK